MPFSSKIAGVTHQEKENNVMFPSSDEAKPKTNSSLDDALDSLANALLTLRHAVERSQQADSHEQQTAQTLAAETADELRAIKSLISEAREIMKNTTTFTS